MTKPQKTLGLALAVQVVLILILHGPFGNASASGAGTVLFPDLAGASVTRVQLSGTDDELVLARGGDGWTLEGLGGFPADEAKVDELIDDLAGLEARHPVVRSGKYHATFKVEEDDHEGRVKLWSDPDEAPVADLIVGNSANYRAVRVRRAGDDAVWEVGGLAAHDVRADAAAWASKKLVDLDTGAVERLSIHNTEGSFTLVKDESGWSVEGDESAALDAAKVLSLLRSVTGLSIAKPLGPSSEHGPAPGEAVATFTVEGAGGKSVILVGDKRSGDESLRNVTVDGWGFSGEIWDTSVKSLLEKKVEDLAPA